jgi:hypothetical protein
MTRAALATALFAAAESRRARIDAQAPRVVAVDTEAVPA